MALKEYYSTAFHAGDVYIWAYYPVKGVLGAMMPADHEPATLHSARLVRSPREYFWTVYTYERSTPNKEFEVVDKTVHLTRWGAHRRILKVLDTWSRGGR